MKIASREVTTAVVVDCPTPLAPPVVVNPQLQPIIAIIAPKQTALIGALQISQAVKKLRAESKNMRTGNPKILLAISNPPLIPATIETIVNNGNIIQQATTRGITK